MSCGQTWADEEVKALLEIWSDSQINQLLTSTHKNNNFFKLFSTCCTYWTPSWKKKQYLVRTPKCGKKIQNCINVVMLHVCCLCFTGFLYEGERDFAFSILSNRWALSSIAWGCSESLVLLINCSVKAEPNQMITATMLQLQPPQSNRVLRAITSKRP